MKLFCIEGRNVSASQEPSFINKVALVTGAASGMGFVTVRAFAEAGAAVVLADVNEEAAQAAAADFTVSGHRAMAVHCNVADEDEVAAMVDETIREFARLDAAFNNAGVVELKGEDLFFAHVHLHGGPAPVRRYLPKLIDLVWSGKINPGKVFDLTLPLDQVAEGYLAMDERRAIKALLQP